MKKNCFYLAAIFAVVAAAFSLTGCGYNTLVEEREAVNSQWANVENRYQERNDLVPNLVNTVKGYAKQEESVFTEIANARSKLGGTVTVDSSITDDPEKLAQFQSEQNQLGSSLQRLLSITEAYPELKSNQNFLDLQSQLEGIENRIATERKRYNDVVKTYNTSIAKFPQVITAKIFGFKSKAYFKADEGATKAPTVSFD
ncbi:MAG: LemA family protein [Treponema sp.]